MNSPTARSESDDRGFGQAPRSGHAHPNPEGTQRHPDLPRWVRSREGGLRKSPGRAGSSRCHVDGDARSCSGRRSLRRWYATPTAWMAAGSNEPGGEPLPVQPHARQQVITTHLRQGTSLTLLRSLSRFCGGLPEAWWLPCTVVPGQPEVLRQPGAFSEVYRCDYVEYNPGGVVRKIVTAVRRRKSSRYLPGNFRARKCQRTTGLP